MMLPTLELGPWRVSTYLVFFVLAVNVAGLYALHRLFTLDYPPGVIARGFLLAVLGGSAAAFVLPWLLDFLQPAPVGVLGAPERRNVVWALVGGGSVGVVYVWKHKGPLGQVFDLGGLPVPLAQAIGRVGCFAAGCCFGKPTDSWLGMYLPDENGFWAVRYPTQLLSGAADLLIFLALFVIDRVGVRRAAQAWAGATGAPQRLPFDGFLALLYIVFFSLKRFGMGFLRESATPVLGPFSEMHLQGLVGLAIGAALILRLRSGQVSWNLRRRGKEKQTR